MKFPADVLSVEVYREGAVRGIGLGALAFATEDEDTGEVVPPKLELYRLAVNRRTYTNSHIEYVASKIIDVYKRRDRVNYGLEVLKAPAVKGLKHFLAKLQPVSL
jgi:tryptophanase